MQAGWDEKRAHQSRLDNLAKAREAKLAKNREKESAYELSPVEELPRNESLSILKQPVIVSSTRNQELDAQEEQAIQSSNRVIDGLSSLALAFFASALPIVTNMAIDAYYPMLRDYFIKPAETEPNLQKSKEADAMWNGQSIFKKRQ